MTLPSYPERDPREIGIFRFFVKQKVFINIVFFLVFVGGIVLWFFILNREAFGNFDFDLVTITTPYPGATAEEVEQLVTLPIENGVKTLEGIEEMYSISIEAASIITLQLDPDEPNKQRVARSIEREVEEIRTSDLPDDGDEPQVLEITAAFPVLTVGLSGDVPESKLRSVAESLEDDFLDIDGVSRVAKNGFKDKQIWVEADLNKLARNHLSLSDLIDRIRQANHTSPGGRLEIGGREIIVRTIGKLETAEDVKRVVIRSNEEGNRLLVEDLAFVEERLERERKFTRLDGSRSVELNVLKKDSGDTLEIDAEIKRIISEYRERHPSVQFAYANEISFYINRRLKVLLLNGSMGMVLVLIIMFLFLSPNSALWGTSAIPFAFLGGIITMYIFGISINLLSLFAFILVSGMLVDNGIVVAEYIEKKRQENIPTFTAVAVGVSEMGLPVFAAALTTIIAFAPLAFMSGITGKFLSQMPMVLIACLISDLLECLFVLPGHIYHYDLKAKIPKRIQRVREKAQHGLEVLTDRYQLILSQSLKKPGKTIFIISMLFVSVVVLSKFQMKFLFFPNVIDLFVINYELPVGASLEKTEEIGIGFEKIAKKLPPDEIDAIVTQVGSQGDQRRSNSGTNVGEVRVFLNKSKPDRIDGQVLMDMIRDDLAKYAEEKKLPKFELEEVRGGPPTGRAIEVQLIGNDYKPLLALSNEAKEFLKQQPGTVGISDDYDEGKDELRLILDRAAIGRAGLVPAQVAAVVRAAFDGETATDIKRVGEKDDIKVRVKLTESDRESRETFKRLTITNNRGRQVPLVSLVKMEEGKGILKIIRVDGDRTVTVKGGVNQKESTPAAINSKLGQFLEEKIKEYPGVKFKFAGEQKNQRESLVSLAQAVVLALGLIYLVLATLFGSYWEPLLIISVIPFALMGMFLSLMAAGEPLTLLVGIGFAGLVGVVVNNSILLVDTFNRNRIQGNKSYEQAILDGSIQRLRPILLTSFSTFFGVMPLGYGIGGKEPFLEGMAYSFGWGLLICSFITIFWIPSLYMFFIKLSQSVAQFWNKQK